MNKTQKMWEEMNEDSNLLSSLTTIALAFFGSIFVVFAGLVALTLLQKLGVSVEIMKAVAAFIVVAPLLIILLHKIINDLAKAIVNSELVKRIVFDLLVTTLQPLQIHFKTRFLAVPTSPPRSRLA
jgi:hypothetical protein